MRKTLTYLFIIFSFLFINHCTQQKASEKEADIALYSDKGTDEDCIKATQSMFEWMGYTVVQVDAYLINSGGLGVFRILCVPGGDMYQYSQDLTSEGIENIENFITNGGGYIGICGGAYFTGEKVIWQGNQLPMTSLGIFPGTTKGPIDEIVPYPEYGMCRVNIVDSIHYITESEADTAWILYYWGPELIPNNTDEVDILGRYDIGDQPVIVALEYGAGRVFLIGTHPEFEEDSDRDGTTFADELDDKGTDWELMKKATLWCLKE